MTARLSPAQQRVVDAMRDGATLRLVSTWMTEPQMQWWELVRPRAFGGRRQRTPTVEALLRMGVVVHDTSTASGATYVLAPDYRGGEA